MNNRDEQLISQFMQANKHEVADNGFSRRVMHRLPVSAKVWSDILTTVCVVLCGVLLYVYDGLNLILSSLREVFQTHSADITNNPNNLYTLCMLSIVLAFLSIRAAWTIKE